MELQIYGIAESMELLDLRQSAWLQAGGEVAVVDHPHIGHRIRRRGQHVSTVTHRCGEGTQLMVVRGLAGNPLAPPTGAGRDGEPVE